MERVGAHGVDELLQHQCPAGLCRNAHDFHGTGTQERGLDGGGGKGGGDGGGGERWRQRRGRETVKGGFEAVAQGFEKLLERRVFGEVQLEQLQRLQQRLQRVVVLQLPAELDEPQQVEAERAAGTRRGLLLQRERRQALEGDVLVAESGGKGGGIVTVWQLSLRRRCLSTASRHSRTPWRPGR